MDFLTELELTRLQLLSKACYTKAIPEYFSKSNRKSKVREQIPSLQDNKSIYQFFGGFLLTIDGSKSF